MVSNMDQDFAVTVAAGTLRQSLRPDVTFAHQWTDAGVAVEATFTGAHLLHLSVAACVLNDLYRESATSGVHLDGVCVKAWGGFDPQTWQSTGISYSVEVDSPADTAAVDALVRVVDDVAEIPRAVRATANVTHARRSG